MTLPLFALSEKLAELDHLLDDATPEEVDSILEQYLSLADDIDHKIDNYCRLIKLREASAKFRREEAKRLSALASADENLAKRLRKRLFEFFAAQGWGRRKTGLHNLVRVRNTRQPKVLIDKSLDLSTIPPQFKTTVEVVDTEAVRAYLESGETLDWADFQLPEDHLQIR
jgi:hypothetical protein